jgi:putative nucleotidyltransferase with HDIG domain
MASGIPGWSPDLERVLKEGLFRFLEEVHATKAALYLMAADGSYLLATQYGFGRRDAILAEIEPSHPIALRARELHGRPGIHNGPDELPEVAEYLEGAGTARMLLVPVYGASRLVGIIDVRDKGRKKPFETEDSRTASEIANAILGELGRARLYPELEIEEPTPATERAPAPQPVADPTHRSETAIEPDGLLELCEAARELMARRELAAISLAVHAGATGHRLVYAASELGDKELATVAQHQASTLADLGVHAFANARWEVEVRHVESAPRPSPGLIATSVLASDESWSVVASVLGPVGSPGSEHALTRLHQQAARIIERTRLRSLRRSAAQVLLRPGRTPYTDLVTHSETVSKLAWAMASALLLEADEVENAALAGLLHDVGMREIDYTASYRHPSPGPNEKRLYRTHVTVGSELLERAGYTSIAPIVRHHHEQWDGNGYPERLRGNDIPLLARIVHLAEVYDTLTSPSSYRTPMSSARALKTIRESAGQQFDPALIPVLAQVIE